MGGGGWGGWGGGCASGFGGGLGGFGLVGLIGLNSFLGGGCDKGGHGHCGGGGNWRGGDESCRDAIFSSSVLNGIGDIKSAIPASTAATSAAIAAATATLKDGTQNQTLYLSNNLAQLAAGITGGFSNTKDSIQGAYAGLSAQNAETQALVARIGCEIKTAIDAEGDSIKALITANRISELETELARERSCNSRRESEINVTQVVNQAQAQAQQQQQIQFQNAKLSELLCGFHTLINNSQFQYGRAGANAFTFGNGNLTGQTPTNTNNQVGGL